MSVSMNWWHGFDQFLLMLLVLGVVDGYLLNSFSCSSHNQSLTLNSLRNDVSVNMSLHGSPTGYAPGATYKGGQWFCY